MKGEMRRKKNQILMDKQSPMFAVNNNFVCFAPDKWWKWEKQEEKKHHIALSTGESGNVLGNDV
jgi:hypothetical protein